MTSQNKLKYLFILGILIAAGFALADSLGVFNLKPYTAVLHGAVTHYVPDNRDPDIAIKRFPTQEPGPNQMITPTGQVIKKSEWEQWQKEHASQKKTASGAAQNDTLRTIEVIGTDQMKFVVEEEGERINAGSLIKTFNGKQYLMLNQIEARPGERLRIRLTTHSQLKPEMMAHNWVLLEQGVDAQAFVNASNRENDYIPPGREEDIIAYTELAGQGETVEVIFTVPIEAGKYEFLCPFTTHYAAGMRGQLIVQS